MVYDLGVIAIYTSNFFRSTKTLGPVSAELLAQHCYTTIGGNNGYRGSEVRILSLRPLSSNIADVALPALVEARPLSYPHSAQDIVAAAAALAGLRLCAPRS
jgi:hypothetical protein